jgi:hypothetical protein
MPVGMGQDRLYREAVTAAQEFGAHRLEEKVRGKLVSARLYVYALRSLDVHGPTQKKIEEALETENPKDDRITLRRAEGAPSSERRQISSTVSRPQGFPQPEAVSRIIHTS